MKQGYTYIKRLARGPPPSGGCVLKLVAPFGLEVILDSRLRAAVC